MCGQSASSITSLEATGRQPGENSRSADEESPAAGCPAEPAPAEAEGSPALREARVPEDAARAGEARDAPAAPALLLDASACSGPNSRLTRADGVSAAAESASAADAAADPEPPSPAAS
jgi:hypothetical protein